MTTIIMRAVNMLKSKKNEVVPAGGKIREELEKHLVTLDDRISGTAMAKRLTDIEKNSWEELSRKAQHKLERSTDPKKEASLKRLADLAEMTHKKYVEKAAKMDDNTKELGEIRSRVQQAISMIEVENNLRSVTSMFEGIDAGGTSEINLAQETREIRQLLHATDGLMELMA